MTRMLSTAETFSDLAFPIRFMVLTQPDLDTHSHDFVELVIVLDGVGQHVFDTVIYPICAGDAFVVDREHIHGYRDTEGLRITNLLFDEPFLLSAVPWLADMAGYKALVHLEPSLRREQAFGGRLRLTPEMMARVTAQVDRLQEESTRRQEGYQAMVLSLLVELLVDLCRSYAAQTSEGPRVVADIGRIISYVENHFREEIDLATLEDMVSMSTRTLLRRFGAATGHTPIQYLLRVRIGRACSLLKTTNMAVTEIAGLVGFDDSNYFSRQFRTLIGSSPTEFRRTRTP